MAGVRSKPTNGGLYQAWFRDYTGKKRYFTLPSKKKAREQAHSLEKQHREIRDGYRPLPNSAQASRKCLYEELVKEYLAWGQSQGGHKGKSWSKGHAIRRRAQLGWWQEQLGLITLADLDGILPRAEQALRGLQEQGRAGKTLANYAEGLSAFCDWCVQRGFLSDDPLKGLAPFDTTPQTLRRLMTHEEITQLLDAADSHRRLLYETAFVSGLRANELRNLSLNHLDQERGGLQLDAEWTKNRKAGFQPLPAALVKRLKAFADTGQAQDLYQSAYRRGQAKKDPPQNPLLYVPSQPGRSLAPDLKAAGIPKQTPKGKIDFHACRVAYINLVLESGQVSPKEAQELARHASLDLTMNVYGRVREDRLAKAVERVGEVILRPEGVPEVYRKAAGTEQEIATPLKTESFDSSKVAPAVGLEPELSPQALLTIPLQKHHKSLQYPHRTMT